MERPRFRTEVVWSRQTFFGATSQMKRSQWVTLPEINMGGQKQSATSTTPMQSCSLPPLAESLPAPLSKRSILSSRSMNSLAATDPSQRRVGAWMHPRWGPGSQTFGAPPLAKLNGKLLTARIALLERGIAKARREAGRLTHSVLEHELEYRGFVQAEQRILEQELALFLSERERRKQAQQQEGGTRSLKRIRCIPVPDNTAVASSSGVKSVVLDHSVSEPSLVKGVLQEAL